MIALDPIPADYASLWEQMPLAAERLKVIILTRTVKELQEEMAALKAVPAKEQDGE